MKFNVVLRPNGFNLSNVIITKSLQKCLTYFIDQARFEKGVWTDDNKKFIPIDSIAYYEVVDD